MRTAALRPNLVRLRDFAAQRSGSLATMAGLFAPLALFAAAFAVDQGSLYVERRNLQSLNDIAAITAAANLNNASTAAALVVTDNKTSDVTVSAPGSTYDAKANSTRRVDLIVERGRYTDKGSVAVRSRFQAGVMPYNAARVTMRKGGNLYFAQSFSTTPLIATSAIAHKPAEAAFSIGSRLLRIDGGLLNSLLNKFLGTNISLSVMDYEALVRTDISAFDFLGALATQLHLQAGTYDDVLNSNVTIGQIAAAMATLAGGNQTAQLALQSIANTAPTTGAVAIPLRHVLDLGRSGRLGIGEKPTGLDAGVSLMEMLTGSAAIANGGKQVSLNLGASVPGLLNLTLDVAVGEPPQHSPFFAIGEPGTIVRTAQTRIVLSAQVLGPSGAVSALGPLFTLLRIASVKVPLYVEVAYAEGRLTDVSCPTGLPASLSVSIAARPGIADIYIGEIDPAQLKNFSSKLTPVAAKLADVTLKPLIGLELPVLRVLGSAHAAVTNLTDTILTFNKAEIDARAIKTVSTSDMTQTLTQTLVNNLTLSVQVLVVGTSVPPALKTAIVGILSPVTPTLDKLLYSTLSALGVRLGEADIRIHGATCGRAVLVQ